jgi:hypothetical protein
MHIFIHSCGCRPGRVAALAQERKETPEPSRFTSQHSAPHGKVSIFNVAPFLRRYQAHEGFIDGKES